MDTDNKNNNKTELKKEDKKALFLSVFMIIFLIGINFWRTRNNDIVEITTSKLSSIIEVPNIDEVFSGQYVEETLSDLSKKENTEQWNKTIIEEILQINVPASWINTGLSNNNDIKNINILSLYSSPNITDSAMLVISKINAPTIEEALAIVKDASEGVIIEILEQKENKNEYNLKTKYIEGEEKNFISLEKFLFTEKGCYFVSIMTEEKNYNNFSTIMEETISSIQIIN
jgi:hypothetical protein